jgi:hypothetical protein
MPECCWKASVHLFQRQSISQERQFNDAEIVRFDCPSVGRLWGSPMDRVAYLRAHAEKCLAASRSMSLFRDAERLRQTASYALAEADRLQQAAYFTALPGGRNRELDRLV